MKNLILSFTIICVSVFAGINKTFAQNTKPHVGFKVGVDEMTFGSISDNGGKGNYSYRTGLQIGLYADVPLSGSISFIPQVLFSHKGGKLKGAITIPNGGVITEGEIDYFDVPLLVGFKPIPKLTIGAGPQVSFFSSQNTTTETFGGFDGVIGHNYTDDSFRKVLIGGNVGIGYNVYKNFDVNLNYTRDFQSPGKSNYTLVNGESNSGFALTVSYLF